MAGPAVPALLVALRKDRSLEVRKAAACDGLGRIGKSAVDAAPDLIAIVADPAHPLWEDAVCCLGRIGPAAEQGVPSLVEAMMKFTTGDNSTKERLIESTLQRIQPIE